MRKTIAIVVVVMLVMALVTSVAVARHANHPHGGPPGQAKERVHPHGGPPGQDPENNRPPGWDEGDKLGWVILVEQCESCIFFEALTEEELALFMDEYELDEEGLELLIEEACECIYERINIPPGLWRLLNR